MSKTPPKLSQKLNPNELKNIHDATGLMNGFWYRLVFSIRRVAIKIAGTEAKERTPNSLSGRILSTLNVAKKYHSGRISRGVANGLAASPNVCSSVTPKPRLIPIVPSIHTGNTNRISLGQAGSPYEL